MRRTSVMIAAFAATLLIAARPPAIAQGQPNSGPYFDRDCKRVVLEEIDNAKKRIRMQEYEFTDPDYTTHLENVMRRKGVEVAVILDAENAGKSDSQRWVLINDPIYLATDHGTSHGIAHNKIVLIDDDEVITGSFNLTPAAANENRENILVLHDSKTASLYQQYFSGRWFFALGKGWILHCVAGDPLLPCQQPGGIR